MAPGAPKVLLSDIVSHSNKVPSNYIRSASDRPDLCNVVDSSLQSIPVIDMRGLGGSNHRQIISQLGSACKTDGFFMVNDLYIFDDANVLFFFFLFEYL